MAQKEWIVRPTSNELTSEEKELFNGISTLFHGMTINSMMRVINAFEDAIIFNTITVPEEARKTLTAVS